MLNRRSLQFALLGYFALRLILSVLDVPVIGAFGVVITTNDLLLTLLFATVVSDYREEMTPVVHMYAFLFGAFGISLYFLLGTIVQYLLAVSLLCIISIIGLSREYGVEESIEISTQFTGQTVLLA